MKTKSGYRSSMLMCLVVLVTFTVFFQPAAGTRIDLPGEVEGRDSALTAENEPENSYEPGGLYSEAIDSSSEALANGGAIVAWGDNGSGQRNIPSGMTGVAAVAGGGYHTLALRTDGTVAAWGENNYGQAVVPPGLTGVMAIAAGGFHSLALKADGTVVAWGNNDHGETGVPAGLTGVTAIAAGLYFSVALKSDGTVVAWGNNSFGQLNIPSGLSGVVAIGCGGFHTIAVKADGTVTAWGLNNYGQLNPPAGLTGVVATSGGYYHSVALKADGTVAAWGDNTYGQVSIPAGLSGVKAIAAGIYSTVALKADGTVVAWGSDSLGQSTVPPGLTGVVAIAAGAWHTMAVKARTTSPIAWGSSSAADVPTGLSGVAAISACQYNTVALKSDGTVVAWGDNTNGQIDVPPGLTGVTAIACGDYHSAALKSDGTVVAWGWNYYGQTSVPAGLSGVKAIACGYHHTIALKADGTVVAWGYDLHGQTDVPPGLTGVTAVSGGGYHTLAIKSDGTIVAWGANNFGQLSPPAGLAGVKSISGGTYYSLALKSDGTVVAWGIDNTGQCDVPAGLTGAVAIAAASYHSLALKADGTITGWGYNANGQLNIPAGLNGVTAIAGGSAHTVVLDGMVIFPASLASVTVGVPYPAVTFTQAGGIGTIAWNENGALPSGMAFDATTATLSGTPTSTGSYPITITATDENGCQATRNYTLVILCQVITVTNPPVATGTAGAAFSQTFTQTGGVGTTTFSTTSTLPAGLALSADGTLSGTPTVTGTFPITVTASDSNDCTGTGSTYTLVIGCQAITVTNPPVANGTAGAAFSQTFTQTGGVGTTTFATTSALPAGLALSADGTLSGTPTVTGTFPITVTASDSNDCTGTGSTYTLVIGCQAITVNIPAVSQGIQNTPFSQSFTQTGGIGTVTFSTTSTLPAGLSLAATGTLSGTPTNYGTFPITVTATDSNECEGSGLYTLTILQLPSAPVITAITDDSPCTQGGITITFTAGSPATRHDLYRDGVLVVSGVSSPIGYNPGDTASHSYVVRVVNTDDACFADSAAVSAADANGTPTQPVITGITDVNAFSFGLVINYTPGSPATRHDLYRDGVLVVSGFVSGGTYNPMNNQSHSYSILAVNASCSTMSSAVTAVDMGSRLVPRPRLPLEPIPFPR